MHEYEVEIIDYSDQYKNDFANLNYEWIAHFFHIEETDRKYLDHPNEMIIEKGGSILLAKIGDKIVGTIALIMMSDGQYELAKMSVARELRGQKIGHKLMDACLIKAREMKVNQIVILSNRKLKNAIYLYEKYGFIDVGSEDDDYDRCDIRMELNLS